MCEQQVLVHVATGLASWCLDEHVQAVEWVEASSCTCRRRIEPGVYEWMLNELQYTLVTGRVIGIVLPLLASAV